MELFFGIVALLVGVYGFARYENLQKRKKVEAAFSGRESQTVEQFYESYFKAKGVPFRIIEGIRRILEVQLGADMSRLKDSDDFSKNLSFFWDFDSMADVEIACALEKEFNIKISDDEAVKAHTVNDIVSLVWRKLQK